MIASVPTAPPGVYSPATDRAMGGTGIALRKSLVEAFAGSDSADRSAEIYSRVSAALHKASRDQAFASPEAVGRTVEILNLIPRSIPLPEVVVESEREMGLDWDGGRHRVVSLTVDDTPMVGFAALFGAEPLYGRMAFTGQIPQTLRFLLRRVHPQPNGR